MLEPFWVVIAAVGPDAVTIIDLHDSVEGDVASLPVPTK